ncbi:MAG: ABC transporter substrate-binding protein [Bacteroidales bacterium]|nr:ABC transporter substrate-binding protein [Bacteroidales bacterium]
MLLYYICLCTAFFCSSPRGQKGALFSEKSACRDTLSYATGFTVDRFDDYTYVTLKDPWNEGKILHRYILIPKDAPLPERLPEGTLVRTPIDRVVVYTSVHASILEELGEESRIIGVCEPQYLTSQRIISLVEDGTIANVGEAVSPNIEKIVDIGTEVLLASPFENIGYGAAEKLGLPIIEGADYMEITALSRAEWIKFYGLLVCKEALADSLFASTVRNYEELKAIAASSSTRPTVITERKYGVSWSIPGGKSYMASLFKDAGAKYVFDDNDKKGATSVSFETALERGRNADYWVMKYASDKPFTYADLRSEYLPYEYFDSFINRKIYTCNTIRTPYYDEIMLYPEYLLADMIHIFHPELQLPERYKQRYYFPMQ